MDSGSLPMVHRGEEFIVRGFIDNGNNMYRQVESVEVYLFAKESETPGGEVRRDSNRAVFDRLSCRFMARLRVKEDEEKDVLFVRVGLYDHIGRQYGPGLRPLAGNELKVRVE
jgi:hypothetical protein